MQHVSARRLGFVLAATFGAATLVSVMSLVPSLTARAADAARRLPAAALDIPPAKPGLQTAVFAGGCFWGIQGVFEHVKGVTQAVSGYAGGTVANPDYETVSSGSTGHAESVRVTYDPAVVSYGKLLQIFFSVALDPTQVNRQGPDYGTQYRSEVFAATPEQSHAAAAYIAQLNQTKVFARPIATRVDPLSGFYPAEGYHQDYLERHPDQPYIAFNDIPKVENLKRLFPESYLDKPVLAQPAP